MNLREFLERFYGGGTFNLYEGSEVGFIIVEKEMPVVLLKEKKYMKYLDRDIKFWTHGRDKREVDIVLYKRKDGLC